MGIYEGKIASFGDKLQGDDHLFTVVDLRLPEDEQKPVVVTGQQAMGFLLDEHYYVTYNGENTTSVANMTKANKEAIKREFGTTTLPKPTAVLVQEQQEELLKLRKQLAENEADPSKPTLGGSIAEPPREGLAAGVGGSEANGLGQARAFFGNAGAASVTDSTGPNLKAVTAPSVTMQAVLDDSGKAAEVQNNAALLPDASKELFADEPKAEAEKPKEEKPAHGHKKGGK